VLIFRQCWPRFFFFLRYFLLSLSCLLSSHGNTRHHLFTTPPRDGDLPPPVFLTGSSLTAVFFTPYPMIFLVPFYGKSSLYFPPARDPKVPHDFFPTPLKNVGFSFSFQEVVCSFFFRSNFRAYLPTPSEFLIFPLPTHFLNRRN